MSVMFEHNGIRYIYPMSIVVITKDSDGIDVREITDEYHEYIDVRNFSIGDADLAFNFLTNKEGK